jgi:5-methylthioadenosine/S-adenosylhomocysteine deaminase
LRILIKNAHIVSMGPAGEIPHGYISVLDDKIEAVESGDPPEKMFDQTIDAASCLVIPGLINTHTHAAMTLLRGYGDSLPLMQWLQEKIVPFEARLTGEHVYWGSKLAMIEMVKSGTTCFADMYFFMDRVAEAVEESGMRAVLAQGMTGSLPENAASLEESREFFARWQNGAGGRIKVWVGPHAPYTCTAEFLRRSAELARELDTGVHIHVAETRGEYDGILHQHGKTPVAYLESLDLLEQPVLAAHGVYLDDADIQILRSHPVSVAHNPESNMKLASGVAPLTRYFQAGVNVSLGTDGASSNNDLSMLTEMRTASLLQKVSLLDPTVLPAEQALALATVNGAKTLCWGETIGRLAPGYQADMAMIRLDSARMTPVHQAVSNLVYSASEQDVDTVMVAGKLLLRNREFLSYSERETIAQVNRLLRELRP